MKELKEVKTVMSKKKVKDEQASKAVRYLFLAYVAMVLMTTMSAVCAYAAQDPLTVINNLSTFIFSLIRAIGLILLGFGIVQIGLSLKSHDPSQRANVRPDLGAVKVVTL